VASCISSRCWFVCSRRVFVACCISSRRVLVPSRRALIASRQMFACSRRRFVSSKRAFVARCVSSRRTCVPRRICPPPTSVVLRDAAAFAVFFRAIGSSTLKRRRPPRQLPGRFVVVGLKTPGAAAVLRHLKLTSSLRRSRAPFRDVLTGDGRHLQRR